MASEQRLPATPNVESQRPVPSGSPADSRQARLAHVKRLLTALAGVCSAAREMDFGWRISIVLPSDCFFEAGTDRLLTSAPPRIARIAQLLGEVPRQAYLVAGHALEPAGAASLDSAWASSATQAVALVRALQARGLSGERLVAASFGASAAWPESYDGPASVAPGSALIEIALLPE